MLYWIGLGLRYALSLSSFASVSPKTIPSVSVLIPARSWREVQPLLAQLQAQTYPTAWEICLAADRWSEEETRMLQMQSSARLRWIWIREVPARWSAKKYALWCAAALAQYDWCVCLDADVEVAEGFLIQWMEYAAKGVAILAPAWLKAGYPLAVYEANLVQVEALGRASWGAAYMATGRGWAVRKAWLQTGLFAWKEEISGDDDLTFQLLPDKKVVLSPIATYSSAPPTLHQALLRKWRHLQTAKHYPFLLSVSLALLPLLQLTSICAGLLSGNWLLPLLLPPLAKMSALLLVRAPHPERALYLDWLLLLLQPLYLVGAFWRKHLWLFGTLGAFSSTFAAWISRAITAEAYS